MIMVEKLFESSFSKFYNEWTDLCTVHKANTIKKSKRETLVKLTTNEWYGVKSRTKFKKQFENQNINLSTTGIFQVDIKRSLNLKT